MYEVYDRMKHDVRIVNGFNREIGRKCPLCGVNEVPDMHEGRVMDVCPSCKGAVYQELFSVKMSFSDNGIMNNGRLFNDLVGEWLEDQTE